MKACTLLATSIAACLSFSATAEGAILMFFDPDDLSVVSNGTDQTIDLGILIEYQAPGEDTLSGFTLDHSESSPDLEVIPGGSFASDFTWGIGQGVTASSISGSNFANHTIDSSGTQLLGTLQYTLDQSFTSGSIPIALTFNNAQRDFATPIPASEIIVTGGTLEVSAIPEPSSTLVLLGMSACGFAVAIRRRRKNAAKQSELSKSLRV